MRKRPMNRWEVSIGADFKEMHINTWYWVDSAQIRVIGEPF